MSFSPYVDPGQRDCGDQEKCDPLRQQPTPVGRQTQHFFFLTSLLGNDCGFDRVLLKNEPGGGTGRVGYHSGDGGGTFRRDRRHRRNKLISPPGQGDDVAIVSRLFIERSPEHGDTLRQAVLVHKSIVPDILDEFVAGESPSLVLHHIKEHIKRAKVERDDLRLPAQGARQSVHPELPELIYPIFLQ